jgi:hypothetical protein
METLVKDEQPSNILLLILEPPRITIVSKDVLDRKTEDPNMVTDEGIVTLVSDVQFWNAASPIDVTLEGMIIFSNALHSRKTLDLI